MRFLQLEKCDPAHLRACSALLFSVMVTLCLSARCAYQYRGRVLPLFPGECGLRESAMG
jgi:hypothetical protein